MYIPSAILSTENLQHNIRVIRKTASNSRIMAMLKANAYGHGIRSTAIRLDNLVDYIGVARIDEALALRKVGVKTPICIMQGVYDQDDVITASCNNFELVVHHISQLSYLNVITPKKVNIWLKVDTGIGRLGFHVNEVMSVFQALQQLPSVGIITLTSHFACADQKDHFLNNVQINKFEKLAKDFPGPKSFANSAAIFNFPQTHYDVVRPGLAIYGVSPISNIPASKLNLKPVMTLLAKIMSIRKMPSNSTIGYGTRFTSNTEIIVATVAAGYGDGYPRTAIDGTPVLVHGIECPIIGRISMDMMTIDITKCNNIQCGDLVTLLGSNLPVERVSTFTINTPYDVLTSIQLRVKFHWVEL